MLSIRYKQEKSPGGVTQKGCTENFCKNHRKAHVQESRGKISSQIFSVRILVSFQVNSFRSTFSFYILRKYQHHFLLSGGNIERKYWSEMN